MRSIKWIWVASLLGAACVNASTVNTGTYVGPQSKRSNISYFKDEGTYQYILTVASLSSQEALQFHYASATPIMLGKSYIFYVEPNPYDDETPTSQCKLTSTWFEDGRVEIAANSSCNTNENYFVGNYVYSEQASIIPNEYRGNWDKTNICSDERAVILEDVFNPDFYTGAATVVSTNIAKNGSLEVIGVEEYERETSISNLNLLLQGDKLHLRGSHHGDEYDKTLVKCNIPENDS